MAIRDSEGKRVVGALHACSSTTFLFYLFPTNVW